MKYIILILTIAAFSSIIIGFVADLEYAQKLIGFGVVGLFLIVFPLFSYYRWKEKNVQDYMLTKENLDKMRERENNK
ncbi:hypothetical protein A8C32_11175 [Flavivirga aquatica]|uniref:Uncharacterized protein n=1 Tax=Flavivirga aquatica TaxID=1849968 RepID=A0A1E5TD54_9FLAO|nr:hypothetical protein [Flavivirga aquatica]OEK09277.1 hypothetical protein A8C32_11175 [Flavivirga aquatica]